jgi:cytochrome c oxidase subunit 3
VTAPIAPTASPAAAVSDSGRGAGPPALRIGVVVWLASEVMFFAGLFAAYFGLRAINEPWPPDEVELAVVLTGLATLLLVSSSFTYHQAVVAAERGEPAAVIQWTLVTFGLGVVFLANQAFEYTQIEFAVRGDPYGSMFVLMTALHGLHVLGGLVLMLTVLGVGLGASSRAPLAEHVTVSSYYWHFVDVVWIVLFAVLYLLR